MAKQSEPVIWLNKKRKVDGLKDHPENPRHFTEAGMKALRNSIEACGYVEPIAVNTDGTILSGHARKQILLDLGLDTVDVRMPSRELTKAEQREVLIRMNANEAGEWSFDGLDWTPEELGGFDFDAEELEGLFEGETGEETPVSEVSKRTPLVKLGDIFWLGKHRVMCGDSTKAKDVEALMDGAKADLWVTDPPYGVSYADKNKFLNKVDKGNRNQDEIENDHHSIEEMKPIWGAAAKNAFDSCTNQSSYYWFACQGGDQMMMMMMMMMGDWNVRHELIWVKNNHVLGRTDYNYKHEPILFGWKRKGTHKFYGGFQVSTLEFYGGFQVSTLEFYGGFQVSTLEFDKPQSSVLHPTMKPVALIELLINNSSKNGETVLDTFLGSGTTLIAAHRLNRICYGMELSPAYIEVILRRFAETCSDDNGNIDFEHLNGSLTLDEIIANANEPKEEA